MVLSSHRKIEGENPMPVELTPAEGRGVWYGPGRLYYGLGVHLGRPMARSYQGELLGNVIDVSDVEAPACALAELTGWEIGATRQCMHETGQQC